MSDLELHIYDFDHTLFRSPEPPSWWNKRKFGHWHSQEVSLGSPFLPQTPPNAYWINSVVRKAQASISDMETWAVMCTGRVDKGHLRYRVAELLAQKNLDFDQVFLNDMGVKTPSYKRRVAYQLLRKYPQIQRVQMWEDKKENLDQVEVVCEAMGVDFVPHLVSTNLVTPPQITKEEFLSL